MAEDQISREDIVKISKQYDLECVRSLTFDGRGINGLAVLEQCVNIKSLSLSYNCISNIGSLQMLQNLRELDLSFNKISNLEKLSSLVSLNKLDVRGNLISDLNSLSCLSPLKDKLQRLWFKDADGNNSNPVCMKPGYQKFMRTSLPNLTILDGHSVYLDDKIDILLKGISPSEAACNYKPESEPWYSPQLLRVSLEQSYEHLNTRTDATLNEAKALVATTSSTRLKEADEIIKRNQQLLQS